LPGSASSSADGGVDPQVTDVNVADTAIAEGTLGLNISGHATVDAQAIGTRFVDMGTGYWVIPVGAPDPTDDGLLTWQLAADFARDLPPGHHDLAFAAIGADGASGTQNDLTLCIDTPVPDNLNICNPQRTPPAVVLSLSWDAAVDLDVIVETPSGGIIGGNAATSGTGATIDRESNKGCVIDNIDRQDVVWQATPARGTYQVWVDLFSACGRPGTSFTLSLWLAEPQGDGTERLVEQTTPVATGFMAAELANGGSAPGLFVGSFVLQ
jgi:hypothetical protein